jgi:membrane protein DedA with SNARE-associated domain
MSPHNLLVHYGYIGVIAALILEFLLIPFPAETILIVSGFMWHQGVFHILPLLIAATFGSWLGSYLAYWIARLIGRPVLLRYGRYIKLDERKLDKAELAFARYSVAILGIGRFIAGIRVLIAYVAGLNKMRQDLYLVLTAISAALWACAFILLGATVGALWKTVAAFAAAHLALTIAAGVVVVVGIVALWYARRRRRKEVAERTDGNA